MKTKQEIFDSLISEELGVLRAAAYRLLGDPAEVDEAVQEAPAAPGNQPLYRRDPYPENGSQYPAAPRPPKGHPSPREAAHPHRCDPKGPGYRGFLRRPGSDLCIPPAGVHHSRVQFSCHILQK